MTELVDKTGWSESTKKKYDGGSKGVNCGPMAEGMPKYISAQAQETVIEGKNNAYIVLGRDRPASEDSGYGGQGGSHCGMISLVAGRLGQKAADLDDFGNDIYVEPNHRTDAAFIYISQKTDIDENFKLVDGVVGKMEAKSGIGIKADNLRLVARQGIKLVTGVDNKLSTNADSIATYGIDIIAGNNDDDIQPIVKGENLLECLKRMRQEINKLNGILVGFVQNQLKFNMASLGHYHITTVPLMPATPTFLTPGSPQLEMGMDVIQQTATRTLRSLGNQKYNLRQLEQQYLTPGDAEGGKTAYINSKYNNVN